MATAPDGKKPFLNITAQIDGSWKRFLKSTNETVWKKEQARQEDKEYAWIICKPFNLKKTTVRASKMQLAILMNAASARVFFKDLWMDFIKKAPPVMSNDNQSAEAGQALRFH